jgi:cytoskeletal protein RodZ
MTARQESRVGTRRRAQDAWAIDSQRAPTVGEVLLTARARKGVDLARAERDTKIRARHLMALENGDYGALPAAVYTKGFLRNYAQYLDLDPDEMLARWRRELDVPRAADKVAVQPPPRPIAAPRHGLKLTPGLVVAVVLALVVTGFAGYVALQLVRFSQNPELTLRGPSVRWLAPGATSLVLTGSATVRATVTVRGTDEMTRTTDADVTGAWSIEVPVSKGRNDLTVVATDPETGRETAPLPVIATVPVGAEPTPPARAAPSQKAGLVTIPDGLQAATTTVLLVAPRDGATVRQGRLRVEGTSDATSVAVAVEWLGRAGRAPKAPPVETLPVEDGVFRGSFDLPQGRWTVVVRTVVDPDEAPAEARAKIRSVYGAMVVIVAAVDGYTRLAVTADGETVVSGRRLSPGERATFQASDEVVVHVGNAVAAHLVVDGVPFGRMGKRAEPASWIVERGQDPRPAG